MSLNFFRKIFLCTNVFFIPPITFLIVHPLLAMPYSLRLLIQINFYLETLFNGALRTWFFSVLGEKAYLMPSGSHRNTPLTSLGTPSSIIKSHIMDLEGPSYSFRSLFHLPGATKVRFSAMLFQLFLIATHIFG